MSEEKDSLKRLENYLKQEGDYKDLNDQVKKKVVTLDIKHLI